MTTETKQCQNCGDRFDFEPFEINGRRVFEPSYCDQCAETLSQQAEHDAVSRAKDAAKNRFWSEIPPIYRNSDFRAFSPNLQKIISEYHPTTTNMGVGIVGASGERKTRAAVLLLEKAANQGPASTSMFLPSSEFNRIIADQFSDDQKRKSKAEEALDRAYGCCFLLLDDLGKGRMTDRAEAELYNLLESRTAWAKPIIWTSNSNARQLHGMFTPDRADAILRRLTEFSTIVNPK
jgi:DNA replication protein DnaC